jgi:transglutaminase-like putative cysteine protease
VIYRVSHLTEYLYGDPVTSSHHDLHLLPRPLAHQKSLWEELSVDPQPARRRDRDDYFGNRATHLEIREPHLRLAVLARSEIEVSPSQAPLPHMTPPWEAVRDHLRRGHGPPTNLEACELTFASTYVPVSSRAGQYAEASFPAGRPVVDAVVDLMHRIHADFTYDPEATSVSTPVDEVLDRRRGVCQDFAHLTLACLRALGLPGRYVSGYLVTGAGAGSSAAPPLVGADASHAWVQSFCPGVGWFDLDPTNDVIPGDRHITLAYGRDFGDVTPLRGVILGGGQHTLRVAVEVTPLPPIAGRN